VALPFGVMVVMTASQKRCPPVVTNCKSVPEKSHYRSVAHGFAAQWPKAKEALKLGDLLTLSQWQEYPRWRRRTPHASEGGIMRSWSVCEMFCTGLQVALICSSPFTLFSQSTGQASSAAPPPAAYGNCAAPSAPGFNICNPGEPNSFAWETSSPIQLIAAATSGTAQVKLMELWADGKKVAQTDGTPFDEPVSLAAGNHTLILVEQDATGTELKSAPFQVAVAGNGHPDCSAPSSPGVNVCSPYPNGCNSQSWVDFDAVGKGKSGTVSRMELWVSGTKIANFPGDRISTSLIMVFGEVSIVEVDSKGASISSSFFFNGPC
jgi:hypothetical protein